VWVSSAGGNPRNANYGDYITLTNKSSAGKSGGKGIEGRILGRGVSAKAQGKYFAASIGFASVYSGSEAFRELIGEGGNLWGE